MKKKMISTVLAVTSIIILVSGLYLSAQQKQLSDKMIRLHVVANSDTAADQATKLAVRDAVLAITQTALVDTQANPRQVLAAQLPQIEQAANRTLRAAGSDSHATVTLQKEVFPTRYYETFSLPSGTYTSLRVSIGEAQGHNWWCVVYPSICMTASMDEFEQAAQVAGLSDGEIKLITEDSEGYELKFKSIELLQKLKNLFS